MSEFISLAGLEEYHKKVKAKVDEISSDATSILGQAQTAATNAAASATSAASAYNGTADVYDKTKEVERQVAQSALAAATSATNAASSATAAANSATAANNAKNDAELKATAASNSATAAQASATQAQNAANSINSNLSGYVKKSGDSMTGTLSFNNGRTYILNDGTAKFDGGLVLEGHVNEALVVDGEAVFNDSLRSHRYLEIYNGDKWVGDLYAEDASSHFGDDEEEHVVLQTSNCFDINGNCFIQGVTMFNNDICGLDGGNEEAWGITSDGYAKFQYVYATTPPASDNSTRVATTAYVTNAVNEAKKVVVVL